MTLQVKRRHRCQANYAKIYAQALLILTLKSYRRCGRRRHDGRSLIWQLDQLRFEASGEWSTIAPHRPDQVAEHYREIAALACTAAVPFEIQKPIPEVIVTRLALTIRVAFADCPKSFEGPCDRGLFLLASQTGLPGFEKELVLRVVHRPRLEALKERLTE